jgi:hypothetical protein
MLTENDTDNNTSKLISLHNEMKRLCDLYIVIERNPYEYDIVQKLKTQIINIYYEIANLNNREASEGQNS